MVGHEFFAKCECASQTGGGNATGVYATGAALPHRHQHDSTKRRRGAVAAENCRAGRKTVGANAGTTSALRTDAPVHHPVVHFESSRRGPDRHHTLDGSEPPEIAAGPAAQ